jgi:hypothetical protein
MAKKWADYLISAVRYNTAETHIDEVRVHEDKGEVVGPASTEKRSTAVNHLEAGCTFATITESADDKWKLGAKVRIVTVSGTKYIRTDADATAEDNLGSLPRF